MLIDWEEISKNSRIFLFQKKDINFLVNNIDTNMKKPTIY